jgi:hypothetical protein
MSNAFPAQTNQSRFMFQQINIASPGTPPVYNVVDGGGSMNSAGFVSSCSGQVIGQIRWDFVMARWSYVIDTKGVRFDPNQASAGAADVLQIKNFIATLANPTVVAPAEQ